MKPRRLIALETRVAAAQLAHDREHPDHVNNGEEYRYHGDVDEGHNEHPGETTAPTHIANYTKGLPHTADGFLVNHEDYERFVTSIQSGNPRDFKDVPLGPYEWEGTDPKPAKKKSGKTAPTAHQCKIKGYGSQELHHCEGEKPHEKYWLSEKAKNALGPGKGARVRAWESAGAGHLLELEGPDPQAVTMPPAPTLDSEELCAEMAEVYTMALLRDLPFSQFHSGGGSDSLTFAQAKNYLAQFPGYVSRRPEGVTDENVLRGLTPGDIVGPYVSQYLLVGNDEQGGAKVGPEAGQVRYGSIRIDQRVRAATATDYMRTWKEFIDVQNGADLRGLEQYEQSAKEKERFRFISRPRDLATYVHYDALYEAYLNACLIMLEQGVPFDRGLPFQQADHFDKQQGFAHFGGPHVLTLVTEVATRALKAVRYQKFNIHRRARPEAIAGLLERYRVAVTEYDEATLSKLKGVKKLYETLDKKKIPGTSHTLFDKLLAEPGNTLLLPMAFCEGSPMHPAYGAGHATVAGACVTILKAFFDHGHPIKGPIYQGSADGCKLEEVKGCDDEHLTVEGELNKLAANISIGRNWAGVHYWTDYTESLRMGEKIALGILEEQKLSYRENFRMTVPLYDGGCVMI